MGHRTCCVVNCRNNEVNSLCKFYSFPVSKWRLDQREKWIAAVKRKNADGSPWLPTLHSKICSAHFIGGKKSDAVLSPSYVPTIFPSAYRRKNIKHSQVAARYDRFMKRRYPNQEFITKYEVSFTKIETVPVVNEKKPTTEDKGCQADVYHQLKFKETTFICNRYIRNNHCDAEIQVEIPTISKIVTVNTPKLIDKGCNTNKVTYRNQSTSTSTLNIVGTSAVGLGLLNAYRGSKIHRVVMCKKILREVKVEK